jgi:hypothetical protein
MREGLPVRAKRIHNFSYKVGAARAKGDRLMSDASGRGRRAEMERTLVQRSLQDEDFRQKLLDDPKATVEQELATQLPEDVQVRVVEESADTIYLVLPFTPADLQTGELSDQDLSAVAGGDGPLTPWCE